MTQTERELLEALKAFAVYGRVGSRDVEVAAAIAAIAKAEVEPHDPIVGTKTWMEDGVVITQNLTASEVYKPEQAERVEPVAVRHSFDGYGWMFTDNGDGSSWLENGMKMPDAELLYTTATAPLSEPVACAKLCELCLKRGYDFCANAAKVTPIIVTPPAAAVSEAERVGLYELVRSAFNAGLKKDFQALDGCEKQAKQFLHTTPPAVSEPLTDMEVKALAISRTDGRVSISKIQRTFAIGYNEAAELCQSIVDKGQCDGLILSPNLNAQNQE